MLNNYIVGALLFKTKDNNTSIRNLIKAKTCTSEFESLIDMICTIENGTDYETTAIPMANYKSKCISLDYSQALKFKVKPLVEGLTYNTVVLYMYNAASYIKKYIVLNTFVQPNNVKLDKVASITLPTTVKLKEQAPREHLDNTTANAWGFSNNLDLQLWLSSKENKRQLREGDVLYILEEYEDGKNGKKVKVDDYIWFDTLKPHSGKVIGGTDRVFKFKNKEIMLDYAEDNSVDHKDGDILVYEEIIKEVDKKGNVEHNTINHFYEWKKVLNLKPYLENSRDMLLDKIRSTEQKISLIIETVGFKRQEYFNSDNDEYKKRIEEQIRGYECDIRTSENYIKKCKSKLNSLSLENAVLDDEDEEDDDE